MYYLTEEHLGDSATETEARRMVELLSARGYNVEYGIGRSVVSDAPTEEDWNDCLSLIAEGGKPQSFGDCAQERAEAAGAALQARADYYGEEIEDAVYNLLVDMMHYCTVNGLSFANDLDRAVATYVRETSDE